MSDQAVATTHDVAPVALPAGAQAELASAVAQLESGGGVLVRLADLVGEAMGRSVRLGVRVLGNAPGLEAKMVGLTHAALRRAFDLSVLGMARDAGERMTRPSVSRAVVIMSGAVGGFMGFGGFVPDVTVTTFAIMRSIARIAQEEGEDLSEEESRRACLQVFALTPGDAGVRPEIGYFSARLMMRGRPLVMLMGEVASRYGASLSQKFALQAVPIVGAVTGAALNAAFLRHYQDAARAHFVIRRLERSFGADTVRQAWAGLRLTGRDVAAE